MNAKMNVGIKKEAFQINLEGGILEAPGPTFKGGLKLYVHPMIAEKTSKLVTATHLEVGPNLRSLFRCLIDNEFIEYFRIHPPSTLAKLKSGDSAWEPMAPPEWRENDQTRRFFGYWAFTGRSRPSPQTSRLFPEVGAP